MGGSPHVRTTRVSVTRTTARLAGLASSGGEGREGGGGGGRGRERGGEGGKREERGGGRGGGEGEGGRVNVRGIPLVHSLELMHDPACTVVMHAGNGVHTDLRDATTVHLIQ